ncbi:hypothetical protein FGG08_003158 [Glutinoglossum americanum]|uniref:Amino acid transporter n=1 Tax=Glutinoglossum americanum TaxID=1670608 RepID=A0A9P8KYE0_9PEZI|nr:hypothetical protein FGG08_003158 [Glutinoglossum americanum]
MSRFGYANPPRDSLELASLASSPVSARSSISSVSGISSSRRLSLENEDPLDSSNPAAFATNGSRRVDPSRSRTYSVSSAFDFGTNFYPLPSTTAGGYAPLSTLAPTSIGSAGGLGGGSLEKHKSLTYLNGLSLVVGLIIGSGIFASPSQVNSNAGSPGASLIVWVVAGVLTWTGAASYAELGGAIPLNGGAQIYLAKIFGELAGFLYTWCAVFVLKPGGAAIISIIFGEYIVNAFASSKFEKEDLPGAFLSKAVALTGLCLVTLLNCLSTKLGTRMGDIFMFFKFVALLGVAITGIVVAVTGFTWKGDANHEWKEKGWFEGTNKDVSSWAVAMYGGLWAFDGWDNVNFVIGEMRNPGRDLPLVIHTAMPLVIASYVLANIAYFFVLPSDVIAASNTVAVQFGAKVFGPIGALVLALAVAASCFGALNATTFTSSRLVYAAGKEGYLPSIFSRIGISGEASSGGRIRTRSWIAKRISRFLGDDESGLGFTPIYAMILNSALTSGYIFVGEFSTLLTFYGVAGYTFYFLTVLGLIVLRVREPHLERPYRTWISTPIIFCCVSLFLVSRGVFADPVQTVVVAGFVTAGIPVFFWRLRGRDGARRGDAERGGNWWKFWRWWRKGG